MIELRFHEELYDGFAIDEAAKLYAPYAALTLERAEGGYIVKIDSKSEEEGGVDPSVVAAELMNYALGKTIEKSRAASAPEDEAAGDLADGGAS